MSKNDLIIQNGPIGLSPYLVASHGGDTYTFLAEEFKHDAGGFAFFIGKQKVAWFDMSIVKAIHIINVVNNTRRDDDAQFIRDKDYIIDLLVEFDEMGFVPMTTVPGDPDEYARAWKEKLIKALEGEHIK